MPILSLLTMHYAESSSFPLWERTAVALFLLLSAGAFWARFRKVWTQISQAKDDVSLSLHPIPKRVRDFVFEVMCQSKVIRQRPLPGIAHAFVFWGFCAFAIVTIN